jgi:hypothetical protein
MLFFQCYGSIWLILPCLILSCATEPYTDVSRAERNTRSLRQDESAEKRTLSALEHEIVAQLYVLSYRAGDSRVWETLSVVQSALKIKRHGNLSLRTLKKIPRQHCHIKESTLLHGVGSMHVFEHCNTNDKEEISLMHMDIIRVCNYFCHIFMLNTRHV